MPTGGHSAPRMACAPAHLCKPPRNARSTPESRSGAHGTRLDRDDDAVCAPRPGNALGSRPLAGFLRQPDGNKCGNDYKLAVFSEENGWRRRESNPRPEMFHMDLYVRSSRFGFTASCAHERARGAVIGPWVRFSSEPRDELLVRSITPPRAS